MSDLVTQTRPVAHSLGSPPARPVPGPHARGRGSSSGSGVWTASAPGSPPCSPCGRGRPSSTAGAAPCAGPGGTTSGSSGTCVVFASSSAPILQPPMMRTSAPQRDLRRRRAEENEEGFTGSFSKKTPPKKTGRSHRWNQHTFRSVMAGRELVSMLCDCIITGAVPQPSWIVTRKESGNVHVTWTFDQPVLRGPNAKWKPLRLLMHVSDYYTDYCGADRGYAGLITHNPVRSAQLQRFRTTWGRRRPYRLRELAEKIPAGWVPPKVPILAIRRNVTLFEALLRWAGRPRNRGCTILPAALKANQKFQNPPPLCEVHDMSRRIERYRER